MSDTKHTSADYIEHSSPNGGISNRQLTTVTLTPEQFESLYLQPRNTSVRLSNGPGLAGRVGNPTPL